MNIIQKSAGMFIATLMLTVIGALQSIIVARSLGPEGTGQVQLAVSIGVIISTFFILGVGQSNIYFLNHQKESISVLFANSIALSAGLGLCASVVVFIALWCGQERMGGFEFWVVLLFSCSVALMTLQLIVRPLLVARFKVLAYNSSLLIGRGFVLCAFFVLFLQGTLNPNVALLIMAFSQVLITVSILFSLRNQAIPLQKVDLRMMGRTVRYGTKLHPINLLSTVDQNMGIVFIGVFMAGDLAAAGYFSRAVAICLVLRVVPIALSNLLYSHWAGVPEDRKKLQIEKVLRTLMTGGLIICLLIYSFGGSIVIFLYGKEFLPAAGILKILVLQQLFWMLSQALQSFFMGCGKPLVPSVNLIVCTITSAAGMIFLIPIIGAHGAAVALAVGHFLSLIVYFVLSYRLFTISVFRSLVLRIEDINYLLSQIKLNRF